MCWEISTPRTESGIYVHQSVEHMCSILPKGILNIIPRDAIDQYFLSARMVQQEMLFEIEVCIDSAKIHTSLV